MRGFFLTKNKNSDHCNPSAMFTILIITASSSIFKYYTGKREIQ